MLAVLAFILGGVEGSRAVASPGGWLMFHESLEHTGQAWATELVPYLALFGIIAVLVAVAVAHRGGKPKTESVHVRPM